MEYIAFGWFGLMVLFLIFESSTVSLISVWFAAGSLAAMIAALLGAQIWLQAVLFVLVSCILLGSLRPFARRLLKPGIVKTNADALVGTTGYLLEEADNLRGTGRIKLGGVEWTARSATDGVIPVGSLVKVERIEGVKVFVREV